MIKEEASNFFNKVILPMWPDWEPSDFETELWVGSLQNYNFELSKQKLKTWFAAEDKIGKRPILGRITKIMAADKQSRNDNEPVLLYTLVREVLFNKGCKMGMNYSIPNGRNIPCKEEIQRRAEIDRTKCNDAYNCNHIILYK